MKSNYFSVYFIAALYCSVIGIGNCLSQNINTVVGKGGTGIANGGWDADGGPATSNQLSTPLGVALDASGNVYIVDASNRRIRKVTPAGIISTVAGHPQMGSNYSASEGVVPTTIEYRSTMYDVAVDPSGNIYFTEMDRMRKITVATNLVNSYAGRSFANGYGGDGGPATAVGVQFNAMASIAVDGSSNVYIADRNNRRIRMVTAATGIVTTVVGTGVAGFSGDNGAATAAKIERPHGLDVNSAGDIFFGDRDNNCIRKVVKATGIITTVAGTPTVTGYSGDGGAATSATLTFPTGVALHPITGDIYFVDQNNQCVRKVTVATGIITTVAGNQALGAGYSGDGGPATSAQLNFPTVTAGTATSPINLAVDASGNIYIPDRGNHVVRKVDGTTGIITTFAGTGVAGYIANGGQGTSSHHYLTKGVATDASGNVYCISHSSGNQVRKLSTSGVITTVAGTGVNGYSGDGGLATSARIDGDGIAVDNSGNIYIGEQNNSRIRKVDAATGIISTIAGTGTPGYNGDNIAATTAQIDLNGSDNVGIAVDASGNIYFADGNDFNGTNFRIRKINTSGTITTIAGGNATGYAGDGGLATAPGCQIDWPCQIALDASSNVYFACAQTGSHCVRKVDVSTGIISTVAGNGIGATTGDGGLATAASLDSPRGLAIDASGNMYIAEAQGNCVRKVNTSGIISTVVGTGVGGFNGDGGPAISALLDWPSSIAITNDGGCFFIADWANNRVRKVDLGGSCPYLYILPIELQSFDLHCQQSTVLCRWSTASETNNDYFSVERSSDGKIWTEAGIVKGSGNSNSVQNYEFTDELPPSPGGEGSGDALNLSKGMRFYRLRQTDFNGKYEYFGPISTNCSAADEWSLVMGNLFGSSSLNGTLMAPTDGDLDMNIMDLQGIIIQRTNMYVAEGSNLVHVELDNIAPGMYFISFRNSNVNLVQKFIKN